MSCPLREPLTVLRTPRTRRHAVQAGPVVWLDSLTWNHDMLLSAYLPGRDCRQFGVM